jgi:hypothetical protein
MKKMHYTQATPHYVWRLKQIQLPHDWQPNFHIIFTNLFTRCTFYLEAPIFAQ